MNKTQDVIVQTIQQPEESVAVEPSLPQSPRASGLSDVVRRNRAIQAIRNGLGRNPEEAAGEGESGTSTAGLKPRTIVVIDDEPDQVESTVLLLRALGHQAVGSTDGTKAVALVTGEAGQVVILDFLLGGMTGADVCSALRAVPATREVKIILLSATPEREIRRSCTQYDTYLSKPTSRTALVKALEKV